MVKKEYQIVLTLYKKAWFWRIDVNGKTVEDCTTAHGFATAAKAAAEAEEFLMNNSRFGEVLKTSF